MFGDMLDVILELDFTILEFYVRVLMFNCYVREFCIYFRVHVTAGALVGVY